MSKTYKKQVGAFLYDGGVSMRVWAPFASSVSVIGSFNNWQPAPLATENDGYWAATIKKAEAGQEYKFVISAGNSQLYKNDPRSLQVTTNAGNSVIVDTGFDWHDNDFSAKNFNEQVVYELHVGTFNRPDPSSTGTFHSAIEKLDYLAGLGVNTVELMPIGSMSMDRGWGYATDYIYAVESLYGGHRAFLEFVDAAHSKGIAVILDVVYNHFGPDGNLDMWQFDGWNQDGKGGIYFYNDWRSSTPWGDTRPDFGRTEVRQYILDNVSMWLTGCHVDGLRVDSTIYLRNVAGHNNDPGNDIPDGWRMLQEITGLAKKINPAALVIAEDVSGNEFITKQPGEGGAGFSAQWEVSFPSVLRGLLEAVNDSDRHIGDLANALGHRYNNDAFQRIIYSDSHDSDANGRSRLSEEISPGNSSSVFARRRTILAAAIVMTAPGIPMLFQGQEFLESGSFNDWQALDWENAGTFKGIVDAHRHLIALRKNQYGTTQGLVSQAFETFHIHEDNKMLAYRRWDKGGPGDDVIVIFNFANKVQKDYELTFPHDGIWRIRFNSDWKGYSQDFKNTDSQDIPVSGGKGTFSIGPYTALILSQDPGK